MLSWCYLLCYFPNLVLRPSEWCCWPPHPQPALPGCSLPTLSSPPSLLCGISQQLSFPRPPQRPRLLCWCQQQKASPQPSPCAATGLHWVQWDKRRGRGSCSQAVGVTRPPSWRPWRGGRAAAAGLAPKGLLVSAAAVISATFGAWLFSSRELANRRGWRRGDNRKVNEPHCHHGGTFSTQGRMRQPLLTLDFERFTKKEGFGSSHREGTGRNTDATECLRRN